MNQEPMKAVDLERIVEEIGDGGKVIWPTEARTAGDAMGVIASLRLIDSVARAHRALTARVQAASPGAPDMSNTGTLDLDPAAAGAVIAATDAGPSEHAPETWGRLQIRERLGRGSFGEVYRAWDPTLQIDVALKLRRATGGDRHDRARFIEEARRLARVKHGNVLVVHGADEHDGRVGIWTELLRGKTLEQWLAEHGPFSAREAGSIGLDLCRALSAIHAARLVHRDVKTENVMREQGGRYVLMDFGSVSEQPGGQSAHAVGAIAGTPLYMAPEMLEGKTPTTAADIYSLGVLLYRLVTGRFPLEAKTLSELRSGHRNASRTPLSDLRPDLPAAFVEVIERALSGDPAGRFGSAGAMERALAAAIGLPGAEDHASQEGAFARRWNRRRNWLIAAAVVTTVAAGLTIGLGRPGLLTSLIPGMSGARPDVGLFRRAADGHGERLKDGANVGVGDKLYVEVESRSELYLYVLNQDRVGHVFVLFPGGVDLKNPLPARDRHRLPGYDSAGQPVDWEVDSAGGTEDFLIIADNRPRDDIERYIASLPRPKPGGQPEGGAGSGDGEDRGVGTLIAAGGPPQGSDHLMLLSRLATAGGDNRGAPWVWRIHLENPAQR